MRALREKDAEKEHEERECFDVHLGFKRWRSWACFSFGLGHHQRGGKEYGSLASIFYLGLRDVMRKSSLHSGDLYKYHPALILSHKTKSIHLQFI